MSNDNNVDFLKMMPPPVDVKKMEEARKKAVAKFEKDHKLKPGQKFFTTGTRSIKRG